MTKKKTRKINFREEIPCFTFIGVEDALRKLDGTDKDDLYFALRFIVDATWRIKFNNDERLASFRCELVRQFGDFMFMKVPKEHRRLIFR